MKKSLMLLMVCAMGTLASAQVRIPFRLTKYNNLILKTVVNQKDSLDLMFQVAMDDGAISPVRMNKVEHILFDKEDYSASNTVEISGHVWDGISFVDNQYSGLESDGKIGMALFKDSVLEINYDKEELVSYTSMPSVEGYQSVPVHYRNGAMFIDMLSEIAGQEYVHPFYLQSGYSGGILYDDNFAEENRLKDKLVTIDHKELKNSAGKSVITNTAEVTKVSLGSAELQQVRVAYFSGELKNQSFSLFGADMMKRFNWIINADRTRAWIKPSKHYKDEFIKL